MPFQKTAVRCFPVTVAQKKYLFLADTGATTTFFDTSIHLGQQLLGTTGEGADGKAEVKLYEPPEAKVGGTSLGPLDAVIGMDLKSMRQFSGHDFYGVLGMDFLSRYVVHIDIEKGELLILKSVPRNAGVEVPVSLAPGHPPFVGAEFAPDARHFMIDTGHVGFDSGALGVVETTTLVKRGICKNAAKPTATPSRAQAPRCYRAGALKIGDFTALTPSLASPSSGAK